MGKYFFGIFISCSGCILFPVHVSFPVRSRTRLGDAAPLGLGVGIVAPTARKHKAVCVSARKK